MARFNWTCPFCSSHQIASDDNSYKSFHPLFIGPNKYGRIGYTTIAVACLNKGCAEVFFQINFDEWLAIASGPYTSADTIQSYVLRPESTARVWPSCIPVPILQDYVEACRIKTASPKASATLSRRCLQGMIRDFCRISKSTLDAEIKELTSALAAGTAPKGVTEESVEAIDHVRKIGNIGAHMEKDINLIIDIDEGEAQSLIDLIEILFEEWYVARDKREKRLQRVKEIRDEKDQKKIPTGTP